MNIHIEITILRDTSSYEDKHHKWVGFKYMEILFIINYSTYIAYKITSGLISMHDEVLIIIIYFTEKLNDDLNKLSW